MSKFGMSPMEAIRSATTRPSEMLGMSGEIGVIAPGANADIIAVKGNPLADISELGRVKFVMKDGKVFLSDAAAGAAH
jgi:imidazolonepropionase-like amidohydrolase